MTTKFIQTFFLFLFISLIFTSCERDDIENEGSNITSSQFYINNILLSNNNVNNPYYTNGINTLKIKSIINQNHQRNLRADVTVDLVTSSNTTSSMNSSYWMIDVPVNTPQHEITYVHNLSILQYGQKYLFHVVYYGTNINDRTEIQFYLYRN